MTDNISASLPLLSRARYGDRPDRIPLSDAQRRLWFVQRLAPSNTDYNLPDAVRIRGELDARALQHAMQMIVERHEVLRTRFVEEDGEPCQAIDPPGTIEIPIEDFGDAHDAALIERLLEEQWAQPFDLALRPPIRVRILRLGVGDFVLLRTFHHIVFDGWSRGIMDRELTILYDALAHGREPKVSPLSVQYADFALWERACVERGTLDVDLAYWRAQLRGAQPVVLSEARSADATSSIAHRCTTTISPSVTRRLTEIGQARGATLYMTLLAGFGALLSISAAQEDLIVGCPIAHRPDPALSSLIGLFVNLLPIRIRLRHGLTFAELLDDVRRTTIDAYQYRAVSFDRIVGQLEPVRSAQRTSLVNVVLNLQSGPTADLRIGGATVERIIAPQRRLAFDLEVFASLRDEGLTLSWVYDQRRFEADRVEHMARCYIQLLEVFARSPREDASGSTALHNSDRLLLAAGPTRRAEHLSTRHQKRRAVVLEPSPSNAWTSRVSPQQAILCGMFAEVLGLERVGIHQDFFELGGHSMAAARLANRVRARFGIDVPIAQIFDSASVAELDAWLSTHGIAS